MQHYNLREIYKPNMYHLGLCMFQLDSMVQELLPDLHKHFLAHAFQPSMYSSSWFLTLFTTALPSQLVCRIFDIFLNEGFDIVFRVGLALLDYHKEYLMTMDMEGMIKVNIYKIFSFQIKLAVFVVPNQNPNRKDSFFSLISFIFKR
jgi:hypothetical protein